MNPFKQNGVLNIKGAEHFAPVFTPGVAQKEDIDDSGLKNSMGYLDTVGVDGKDAIQTLYKRYPRMMIDEMIEAIRRHKPDVTDAEIAVTIMNHL